MAKEAFTSVTINDSEPLKLKSRFPLLISAVIVVLGLSIYAFIPEARVWINKAIGVLISNDKESIKSWVTTFGWFGPILLVLAMIGQMFLMVIPTTLLLVVCILAYGPVWGSAIALLAIYAASSAGYFIGRAFGSITVEKILGSKARTKSIIFLEKYGFWAIFITRLNPFLSNDVVSLVGGMVKMDYWKFTAASLAGIVPLILCIAIFGESTKGLTSLLVGSGLILVIYCIYEFFLKKRLLFSFPAGNFKKKK